MNFIFYSPLLLTALIAVPALVAIYLLRNKFRTHIVSTLMLWIDQKKARQGGLQISRIQTPLLFLLELLTIILLILSAAGLMIRSKDDTRIFIIVLDDSFSMLASDGTTAGEFPRQKAVEQITKVLENSGSFDVRFILAGRQPQLLGSSVKKISQVKDVLGQWKCLSPAADLGQAAALAGQLAGQTAHILIITDHKPDINIEQGRLEWWALGRPVGNVAFVDACRSSGNEKDRCLLTVANFSEGHKESTLIIQSLDKSKIYLQKALELGPNQQYRLVFEPEDGSAVLNAVLKDDSLNIDNEIILLPQPEKIVKVQLNIGNQMLLPAVKKAVEAVKDTRLASEGPHLLITDSSLSASDYDLWTVRINSEPNAAAFVGPFIIDRSHPLTEGLSLNNVIWAAAGTQITNVMPVVAAGNIPLITDRQTAAGSHNISIRLNPELSTLIRSADWPILFWNLINWRKSSLPGLLQSNYKLGSTVTFISRHSVKDLSLTDPAGNTKKLSNDMKTIVLDTYLPGLYKLSADKYQYLFSVNSISAAESNLTGAAEGRWGQWQQATLYWWEYKSLDVPLLLTALVLLALHRLLTARQIKGATQIKLRSTRGDFYDIS